MTEQTSASEGAPGTIKWSAREEAFVVPAHPDEGGGYDVVGLSPHRRAGFARLSDVADVSLAALKRAMVTADRYFDRLEADQPSESTSSIYSYEDPNNFDWPDDDFAFVWAEYDDSEFDTELSLPSQHELALIEGTKLVLRTIVAENGVDAEWAREPEAAGLVLADLTLWPEGQQATEAWLRFRGLRLRSFERIGSAEHLGDLWLVTVDLPTRHRTIGWAAALGTDLNRFVRSLSPGGRLNPEAIKALIVAGHVAALIGAREDQFLEAKRFIRFEGVDAWEHAKDAAAFANTTAGGIIVYGLSTRKRQGYDEVTAISAFTGAGQDRKLHRELDRLVFPAIEGLETVLAPAGSGGEVVLMVFVPPQPPELRPFLVKGAVIDGGVNGSLIALYRRRGDDVIAASAEGLHAALAAGLALLRNPGPTT